MSPPMLNLSNQPLEANPVQLSSLQNTTLRDHSTSLPVRAQAQRRGRWVSRLVIFLILAGCCGGGVLYWPTIQAQWSPAVSETDGLVLEMAKRAPFQISVTERGIIDSMRNASLVSKVEGQTSIISIVPEGTQVKEGDIVCELDASTLVDKETQQEIAVVKAKALLEQAEGDLDIQKLQNVSDNEAAELKKMLAELDRDKFDGGKESNYQGGEYAQQLADINAEMSTALAKKNSSTESRNFVKRQVQKGYKNQNDLEAEELNLRDAESKFKSAEMKLEVLQKFTFPRTKKQLEASVKEANSEADRINRKGAASLAQFEAEFKSRELTYEVESKKLERLKTQIDACKIKATQEGQVVYANTRDGRSSDQVLIEVGATVRERQPIINLPDLNSMKVNGRIHESRISLVTPGLHTSIRVDAYADENFHGEVDTVASVPSSTGSFSRDIKEYEAVIKIVDEPDKVNKLRPGLNATIEILVERREDVLQIPVQAVLTIGTTQHVFVVRDKSVERKQIKIGQTNEKMIEVIEGLDEGTEVVINPRTHFKKQID
ncbi:MAG: HlyD family efflux transporter periplasmic adaptor subunit, partial [Planctomycetes bacterium]|nr:HlyD family efflux transporter periplasmic adaptor subunit [Planctomycetota bacterium]